MTLLELLIAMSVVAMVVGTLGALANGVQQAYEYNEGQGAATQHARVVLDRITRAVNEATANEQFPGFIILADTAGPWQFPDTLVVWHPSGPPADPKGLPRFNELAIYCPHASAPNNLVEITVPSDTRIVPPVSNQAQWATEIQAIKQNTAAQVVTLTDLLRTCLANTTAPLKWRGAVRFARRLNPSDSQWAQYKSGNLAWQDLYWVQGLYGAQTGLRQAHLRIELQLMPGKGWVANNPATQRAITFFGSAAVYYTMHR
jgi:type II secretory pathway pseudopilin PulG